MKTVISKLPGRCVGLAMMILALAGCGGGDDQTAAVAPLPKPVPVAKAKTPVKAKAAPAKPAPAKPKSTISVETDPGNLFQILPAGSVQPDNVFAVLPKSGDENTFAVLLPEGEADADSFRILRWGAEPIPPHAAHPGLKFPKGFEIIKEAGYDEDGLPMRIRSTGDGAEMVLVPFGPGVLGSENGPENTRPKIATKLKPFYMDVTEVTVEQYRKFLKTTKDDKSVRVRVASVDEELPGDLPMTALPWGDAVSYCQWLGKSLPTEAQWDKAARGEAGFPHPWGFGKPIWFPKRSRDQIDPVKFYATDKSPYGIYDLAGNAREWCADWYRPDAFASIKPEDQPLIDWEGPKIGDAQSGRVVKGNGPDWKAWHRAGESAVSKNLGFRGVLTVTQYPLDPPGATKTK